jgi:uncharacterized protein
MRPDRSFSLGVALAAALAGCVLAACTIPGAPQAPSPGPQSSASGSPSATPVADCVFTLDEGGEAKVELGQGGSFDEVTKDISKAQRYVDGFWQRHWDECFAEADYRAPEKRGIYTEDDPENCDGTAMDADNAFYCPDGHFVAYGRELMRRAQDSEVGVQWAYLVAAHEWGHAIQQLLQDGGYEDLVPNPLDAKHELQADCLAGAALWGSDHEGFLEWDPDDSEQVAADLLRLSDETPWTKVTPQGDIRTGGPLARIAAFQAGLNADGVKACFAGYR